MNAGYHINVFWSADDEAWIAHIPDLSGCSASGTTPEEAVREVQVALELWLQVASEKGQPHSTAAVSAGHLRVARLSTNRSFVDINQSLRA